jgi:hypothetical protein
MALRTYEDPDGKEWRVWRVVPDSISFSTLGESYRGGWLCFERVDGSERKRLSMNEVPEDWEALAEERLDLLRRMAEPGTRRFGASARTDAPDSAGKAREQRRS